jgi:hypothetical protein
MKNEELPKGAVMSEDVAKAELEKWFDHRKMKEKARANVDDELGRDVMADKLVEGFMYGLLTLSEDGYLTQKLDFVIETESKSVKVSELVWKPRFKERELAEPMKGVKANDSTGRMKAYIAAITGVQKALLGSMDYSDYSLSQTIVSYFLL